MNPDYLKKIAEIANGNIRLAFLAGMRSINDGYQAIRNAEDILKIIMEELSMKRS